MSSASIDANLAPRIALDNITRRFGPTIALDDVSFRLRRGTVHALLGENGAGKTTLMRIAFGLIPPDAGAAFADGRSIGSAHDSIAAGIGMVHQHFTNVPAMTVAENVALGGHGWFRADRASKRVLEIGAETGLALDPAVRAEDLSVGAQQRLEIVKALARDADSLILDEPTAVLAPNEAAELLTWLRAFADRGGSVVLVTHRLREALMVADDVTVLRRGRHILTESARALDEHTLAAALLGEERRASEADTFVGSSHAADTVLRITNVDVEDERGVPVVRDASLSIAAGEILGIAAVEGAGHRELLRLIAGRIRALRGTVDGERVVGFVPEDRQRDALVVDFSLAENVALLGAGARRGRIAWRTIAQRTEALVREFDIRAEGARLRARALSGGNQQKLVLARELSAAPRLLVAENPTRGLDIRATRGVHERLRRAAAGGTAVVIYSSDLDEVLALATRLVVVHAGQLRETSLDRDDVGRAMLGVAS
ncbi:MAG TPA: ATP-binding cassette domain-containing protein [Gemmatimonadaceae bacterium]|nr:ATP-binding cassette domain-containing protein [Gemmatimonadaceae bacterium]